MSIANVTPAEAYFSFVVNVGRLVDAESYALAEGIVLRRATEDEVAIIKPYLEMYSPVPIKGLPSIWERPLNIVSGQPVFPLPMSEARFFVISFRSPGPDRTSLGLAYSLCRCELEIGFTVSLFPAGRGIASNPAQIHRVAAEIGMMPDPAKFFFEVSSDDVAEIVETAAELDKANPEFDDVKKFARQLAEIRLLPSYSSLLFLGYFAILESVLTHQPKPKDTIDSITRQIKKKIALLNGRFPVPLDYRPFQNTDPDQIWSAMYDLRSTMAHGGKVDFESSPLKRLNDFESALVLLKDTVKKTVRHCLREPRLVRDLREC